MKKIFILFLFLMAIPPVFAQWFYDSQNVVANIDISSEIETSGYVESATVNLTFFPKRTDSQELLKFYTNPQAEITDKAVKFNWKRPQGKMDFNVNADVKITSIIPHINKKINFPIESLPNDIIVYTKPSEIIDSGNEEVIRTASELVKGEDDLYAAVFKLAEWTKNNVNYNLSTLSDPATKKASWVLQYKKGVCGELTSLFIALARSVGIPARVATGMSYTNSPLFPENWGAHAWAEVYFTGYGWIPFDVTYGEFGWIDPTHIKFKDSVDTSDPSAYYSWLGRDADLKTKDLNIKTNLVDKSGYYKIPLVIEASVLKTEVNFGSYNLVTATVKNPNDFYYSTELYLSKPKEVKIIGDGLKSVLLLPGEAKKLFWIVKVDDSQDKKFSYTFPLVVSTSNNISASASFISDVRESDVSLEEIKQVAKLLDEEKGKKYSGNVELKCKSAKDEFYEYEDVRLYCTVKNTGNIFLDNVDACFEGMCNKTSLGISQEKNFVFEINKSSPGLIEKKVTLRNDLVSKELPVKFIIDDAPKITIEDLTFPTNVSYNENFTISFTVSKKSQSNPKDVVIMFSQNGAEKRWNIDDMKEGKKFVLTLLGKELRYGKNDFKIQVSYHDSLKKSYNISKGFSIDLVNVNLWQRFLLWWNGFF